MGLYGSSGVCFGHVLESWSAIGYGAIFHNFMLNLDVLVSLWHIWNAIIAQVQYAKVFHG